MREAYDAEVALWRLYTNYPEETRWWALREVPGHTSRVEIKSKTSGRAQAEFETLVKEAGHRAAASEGEKP
jgi:hypothetical protein